MTRNQIITYLASIISTIDEVGEAHTGTIYAALMSTGLSHGDFMALQTMLVSSGTCTLDGTLLRLTDAGKRAAVKINAAAA